MAMIQWGHVTEACIYFRRAVACNPGFLPARSNLQGACNLLVERWHFRMLNDSIRNDAYQAAITRRVLQQGSRSSVLDIGTGTGLLSLFAVEAGAGQVFACDCSSTMIQIASDVLKANGVSDKVSLINKLSSDIDIPADIPTRVSLVVTETVDAGLLGEGILQSLVHAWDHLLLPPDCTDKVRVVPEAATIWIVPLECLHIARKYRLYRQDVLQSQDHQESMDPVKEQIPGSTRELNLNKLRITTKLEDPYDTEDLNSVPGGYKFLASPCQSLHINFNSRQDISDWLDGQRHIQCSITYSQSGRVDAIAAWFDLHLDDVTTLTSAPVEDDRDRVHKANCWDQAVFPLQSPLYVTSGEKLNLSINCHDGKLSVEISELLNVTDTHKISKLQDAFSSSKISVVCNEFQMEMKHEEIQKCSDKSGSCGLNVVPSTSLNSVSDSSQGICKNFVDCGKEKTKCDKKIDTNTTYESEASSSTFSCNIPRLLKDVVVTSQEVVRFLNDKLWMDALKRTAVQLNQKILQSQSRRLTTVLDLSPFPILGLQLLKMCPVILTCIIKSPEEEIVVRKVLELNAITATTLQCLTEKQLLEVLDGGSSQFDVIVTHPVDPSGELKETAFNMIQSLRSSLTKDGIFIPQNISVIGQLVESDWLAQVSHVQNNSNTCGFDIASFINMYQVSQHLDLTLSTVDSTVLSEPVELVQITLNNMSCQSTQTVITSAVHSGMANAVTYWFSFQFYRDVPAVCTNNSYSHVNQAAILFQQPSLVQTEQTVKLLVRFHQGLVHVEIDGTSS